MNDRYPLLTLMKYLGKSLTPKIRIIGIYGTNVQAPIAAQISAPESQRLGILLPVPMM
jgi:hypothetical protein